MKKNLAYLLFAIALIASCSPAYKTGQTPDDVYYSPAKKIYVADNYESYNTSSDDAYLRMKVKDHDKWSSIDDYNYWYDSRYYANNYYSPPGSSFSLGVSFGSYPLYAPYYAYNPYFYNPWYSWYNPCYTVVYYKNPSVYYKPVSTRYNVSGYTNKNYNNYNLPLHGGTKSSMYYNNSNLNSTKSSSLFNQNHSSNSNPVRTFNSGGSSGGGGGHISGGGGGRVRP